MELNVILFMILGTLAIASAVGTVASKNPVSSALSLVVHFFMLAGLYLTLQAQFVAVVQILVYAGAIMVLVVFVIMLLNLENEAKKSIKFDKRQLFALVAATILVLQLVSMLLANPTGNNTLAEAALVNGTTEGIGTVLFTKYILPFEAIGILLLAAIIGAVKLAKRNR